MNPIDQIVRDVAAPVLKEVGYRKDGRNFRIVGGRGDVAIINARSNRLGRHDAEILIDMAVAVVPHVERTAARGFAVKPGKEGIADGFWRERLWGPPGPYSAGGLSQHWGLDLGDEAAAAEFASALREAATRLKSLAERENMIAAVRNPATIPQVLSVFPRSRALAMLLVDEPGADAELGRLLAEIQNQERGGADFVAWARDRRAGQLG